MGRTIFHALHQFDILQGWEANNCRVVAHLFVILLTGVALGVSHFYL